MKAEEDTGMPEKLPETGRGKNRFSPRGPQNSAALLDFRCLISRTVKEYISIILGQRVCCNLLQQAQEVNTVIKKTIKVCQSQEESKEI